MANYQQYTEEEQILFVATEHPMYGSSRIGVDNRIDTMYKNGTYNPAWHTNNKNQRNLGLKSFELSNHLGNVLVTVSDKKAYVLNGANITFEPEITTISDYYPFGSAINTRSYYSGAYTDSYRYGFNGKELDKYEEGMGGGGSTYDYGFRIYNLNLGKFLSVDPLFASYPWYTPYQFAGNRPVNCVDLDGLEEACVNENTSPTEPNSTCEPAADNCNNNTQNSGTQNSGSQNTQQQVYDDNFVGPLPEGAIRVSENLNSNQNDLNEDLYDGSNLNSIPSFTLGTPTNPNNIKLKKIGDAYYTNVYYNETFFSLNIGNTKIMNFSAIFYVAVPLKDKTGSKISVIKAKTLIAQAIDVARSETFYLWLNNNITTADGASSNLKTEVLIMLNVLFDWGSSSGYTVPGAPISDLDYL